MPCHDSPPQFPVTVRRMFSGDPAAAPQTGNGASAATPFSSAMSVAFVEGTLGNRASIITLFTCTASAMEVIPHCILKIQFVKKKFEKTAKLRKKGGYPAFAAGKGAKAGN